MFIVPACVCVCGDRRRWGELHHSQRGEFRSGDRVIAPELCVQCMMGKLLFDNLRTVAPGLGLSLGQSQPGRLCGNLLRVTGREALWHLLDWRGRWRGVCDLHWGNKRGEESCYAVSINARTSSSKILYKHKKQNIFFCVFQSQKN